MVCDTQTFILEDCLDALIDYRGKTPKKTDAGIPLITAKIVKLGRIETPNEFIAEADYEPWMTRGYPELGDVVLTTEAPLGEVGQINFLPVALAQRVVTLRGKKDILDNDYLLYLLQTEEMQSQLVGRASGTTVIGIKQSELRKVEVQLPLISEQREVASTLKALDDRIDNLRQTNATLEAIAAALFKSWFVDFDGIAPEDMQESELGLIPKGWWIGTLGDLCEKVESGGTPKRTMPQFWDGDILWLTSGEVRNSIAFDTKEKITALGMNESSAKLWPKGTTVIAMYGATAGESCFLAEPLTANQACCGLIPKGEARAFLFMIARKEKESLASRSTGSAQQNLNKGLIQNHPTLLPPRDVLAAYEDAAGAAFDSWVANERYAATLAQLRDLMLPRLISGQLRIEDAQKSPESKA
jgi:type I restriction enzyme S subunit